MQRSVADARMIVGPLPILIVETERSTGKSDPVYLTDRVAKLIGDAIGHTAEYVKRELEACNVIVTARYNYSRESE